MQRKFFIIFIISIFIVLTLNGLSKTHAADPLYTTNQLAETVSIQVRNETDLMSRPGVQGVGIGEKDGRLAILVLTDQEASEAELPMMVENVPVVVKKIGQIVSHQMNLGTSTGNDILCTGPTPSGPSSFCDVGTSGYKVCDNTSLNVGGWISNNHVAASGCPGKCPNNAPINTNLFSPGLADAPTVCSSAGLTNVGTLNRFITLVLDDLTDNDIDAAFVQSTDQQVSDNIQGLGLQSNAVAAPFIGQAVCKSGRTSGVTCGTVTGVNLTIRVRYDEAGIPPPGGCGLTGIGRFVNQIMYSPTLPDTVMSQPGDSGAPVVDDNNNAVALNFAGDEAGNGFGNPMGTVLSLLNVTLCSDIQEPPTCDANGHYIEECEGVTTTIQLDGTGSSDPDPGDALTYSWTTDCPGDSFDNAISGMPVLTVDSSSSCSFSCNAFLTVTDSVGNTDSCSSTVTVTDTIPPQITAPADVTTECTSPSGASPDIGTSTVSDICDAAPSVTNDAPSVFPGGATIVSWTATDACNNIAGVTQTVNVLDTIPPSLTLEVSPEILWPPNHKMVPIAVTMNLSDICDANPGVTLSITMNEGDETNTYDPGYDSTIGDGHTSDDIQVDANGNIFLRAERSGAGSGRIYTITYTATDASGNSTSASATVTVPHNQ